MKKNGVIAVLLTCVLCLFSGCSLTQPVPPKEPSHTISPTTVPTDPPVSELTVHFLDVGQADAIILRCEDDTMIIDGGNTADSSKIIAYLKKLNVPHIDYMICTHAHEDHVGGLSAPLSVMPVGGVYAPKAESDSRAYQTFKQKVAAQNSEIMHPVNYELLGIGSAKAEILASPNSDNLNNTSIIVKVTHKNNSFLFTGDAETEEEQLLTGKNFLNSDVLKVAHHGSDTSTSYSFLREVMPEYAVISVGKNNQYGHPSEAVLSRLRDAGAQVYRTDLQGDIIMKSDGDTITVTTSKNEDIQTNETAPEYDAGIYIGNRRSKKFHRTDCHTLPSEKNRIEFINRSDAVNEGYTPCGNCRP
ncbi:MAG: MBL fold metallo-hydrolase [Clostridia bacterium]|nr:MBL fold metallo-hydrolase [Clostridia bacterium]